MKVDLNEIRVFFENLCRDSEHPVANFWRGYWLETGHFKRLVLMLGKLSPLFESKPSLLDIGSFGEFPLILRKFYGLSEVYANSFEGNFIGYANGRLVHSNHPAIEIGQVIEQCDVERQPLKQETESLDIVTSFEVLEHLRFDPMFMLLEIHRVLRKDGLLVLSTPNASSWDSLAKLLAFESPFLFSSYFADGSGIGHCKEYSVYELSRIVENAGFGVEKLETFDSLPPNPALDRAFQEVKDFVRRRTWWKEELRAQTLLVYARKSGKPRMRKYAPLYTEDQPILT